MTQNVELDTSKIGWIPGDEKIELDEDELVSFLNEYYTVNPNSIPKSVPY